MEFTKQQLSLFANFYNANLENEKDFDDLEQLFQQKENIDNKILETIKRTQVRNTIILGLLKGILLEKENTPLIKAETKNLLIQGGEEMKYRGVKIIKHKIYNTWSARPTINGKQIFISARTQQECYNKLKTAINKTTKTKNNQLKPQKKKSIKLCEWYKKWLELYKKDVKETTKKDYNSSLIYIKDIFNKEITEITSIEILELLNKIEFERRKQKVYELLNDIFNKAEINEIIDKNPLNKIDKPKHKKINGQAISSSDELNFEKYLKIEKLDIFLLCLYQGLRKGEALALTIDDFDFTNKKLNIDKSININNEIDTTKNTYSVRSIPLFDNTIKLMQKYKNEQGQIFKYTYKQASRIFEKFIKKYFNGKKYTIHSLRHTFITRCQEQNIPIHIIQKWVGHSKGSIVTSAVYTHTREKAENEFTKIFNENII